MVYCTVYKILVRLPVFVGGDRTRFVRDVWNSWNALKQAPQHEMWLVGMSQELHEWAFAMLDTEGPFLQNIIICAHIFVPS